VAQGQDISRGGVERLDRYPVVRQVDHQWEARAGAVTALDRMLVRLALARLGDPGCAVVLWDGNELSPPRTRSGFASRGGFEAPHVVRPGAYPLGR